MEKRGRATQKNKLFMIHGQIFKRIIKWAIILGTLHSAMAIINTAILLESERLAFKIEVSNNFALFFVLLTLANFLVTFFTIFFALKEILEKQPTENKWFVAIYIQALGGFLISGILLSLIFGQLLRPSGTTVQLLAAALAAKITKTKKTNHNGGIL